MFDFLCEIYNLATSKKRRKIILTKSKRFEGRDKKALIKDKANAMIEAYDRIRKVTLDPTEPFLQKLGISDKLGRPRQGMKSKLCQCQRFCEIVGSLIEKCDYGPKLVQEINAIAEILRSSFYSLRFVEGTIESYLATAEVKENYDDPIDILIALHTCDTATDDALWFGIKMWIEVRKCLQLFSAPSAVWFSSQGA